MTPEPPRRQLASDNNAGICPEAWEALERCRHGHASGYGDDPWTADAAAAVQEIFGTECEVFFVFNGTAANSLALSACGRPFESVLCHEMAHIHTDECSAPEFFTGGSKLVPLPGEHGRLLPETVRTALAGRRDVHFPRAGTLSLTQSTELGTVYSPEQVAALTAEARALGLRVHMDGARFANAVATLGCHPADVTWRAGVDVLCFGGTKNGLPAGEAVVFFNRQLAADFAWRRKQGAQLGSKMRFLSAPWAALLRSGAWLRHAARANAMAAELARQLAEVPGLHLLAPPEANAVFVDLPPHVTEGLHSRGWHFYPFIGTTGMRLMCAWDTQPEDLAAFVADLRQLWPA